MIANEKEYSSIMAGIAEKEYTQMQTKGMEVIQFTPDETKEYVDLAYKAGWDEVIKEKPVLGALLKKMLTP